jgi:hypothetical protein
MMVLNDNGTFIYQKGKELKVTRNSVSFEDNFYQLCNITGFSAGRVKRRPVFSYWWIIIGFILGAILIDINMPVSYFRFSNKYIPYGTKHIGFGIVALSILGIIINLIQETKYGLILTLNSGDKYLFITTDIGSVTKVVNQLNAFIESKQDGVYMVSITNNSVKVKGNITGVTTVGTRSTTISSNVNNSGDKA